MRSLARKDKSLEVSCGRKGEKGWSTGKSVARSEVWVRQEAE